MTRNTTANLLDDAIETIHVLRRDGARIHSITNTVAQNFTANVLLACNTKPSMTANPDEVEAFTSRADALHVNLGTLDQLRMNAIEKSIKIANKRSIPILLDPVMAHVSPLRAEFAGGIMNKTNIIRGNEHEIKTLRIEEKPSTCVVMTGEEDQILHGSRSIKINNGVPILAKVIATGCALGALISALSSKTNCPVTASTAGLIWFGVASELANIKSQSPGSFAPTFIDALYEVELDIIRSKATIS